MPTDPKDPHASYTGLDPARQAVALFRYSVIADLAQLPAQHRGLYKLLHDKAEREWWPRFHIAGFCEVRAAPRRPSPAERGA